MAKALDIIIPAAGAGRRMRSYGPKALIPVNGEPIVARQIRILRALYPRGRTVVVAGFEADRLKKALPAGVRVVVNQAAEETNVAYSIMLGLLRSAPTHPALVVYGDLVFTPAFLQWFDPSKSCVLVDQAGAGREQEVGLTVVGGHATHFEYGLPQKWAHVACLRPDEKFEFARLAAHPSRAKHFGYEVLNEVLDAGGRLLARPVPPASYAEVDTSKDIARAAEIAA